MTIVRSFFVILLLACFTSTMLLAQDSLEYKKNKSFFSLVDSMFIDRDISNWSLRLMTNYKDFRFKLINDDHTLSYTPNNPSGIGFGLGTSKVLIDLIFNIKSGDEEPTERFDMQGSMQMDKELFVFQVQDYKGFNVENKAAEDPGSFRKDIRALNISLEYIHVFERRINLVKIYSGTMRHYESAGSFLIGGYAGYQRVKADSSIVPARSRDLFNEYAQIENIKKVNVGVTGGYSYYFNLPVNMFLLIGATPGLGLNFRNISTETLDYNPADIWELFLYANIILGYNGPRFYLTLSNENTWGFSSLDHGNRSSMNATKAKLVFGWRIKRRK